jgi:predicted DNA-binding protein YlxM (UPF0122 family)
MGNGAKRRIPEGLLVPLLAVAATAVTYLAVHVVFDRESYTHLLFYERSWIQYATTFVFWFTMGTLVLKHRSYRFEVQAYGRARGVLDAPDFPNTLIWSDAQFVRDRFTDKSLAPYQGSMVFSRIVNALDRLRKAQSTKAMEDYFRTRGEFDAAEQETGYTGVRYCVWLIPTLGFLGTVMGIGFGLAEFAKVLVGAQGLQEIREKLPIVTDQIATAFDTTLLALVLSALAVFYMSYLTKRQEQLLEQIDNLCLDSICAVFQEHSTASEQLVRSLQDSVEELTQRMNGNRGAIEDVLRRELPQLISYEQAPVLRELGQALSSLLQQLNTLIQHMTQELGAIRQSQGRMSDELATGRQEVRTMSALLQQLNAFIQHMTQELEAIRQSQGRMSDELATGRQEVRALLKHLRGSDDRNA